MVKSLLTLNDITRDEFNEILNRCRINKEKLKKGEPVGRLDRKIVGMLFEKPSTRTRAGFETATLRLGGQALYMSSNELQLKRGEPIKDTARILGSYVDMLVARVYGHDTVEELAKDSGVPVINGLSDLAHPTQGICDLFTIQEVKGKLEGLTLAYIGDGNNVCHSLLLGCAHAGMNIHVATPKGFEPDNTVLNQAKALASGTTFKIVDDPRAAAEGADILYTDTWVSMGEEAEKEKKIRIFTGYQINAELLKAAAPDAKVMHCLPAYRGLEITDEVMEGPDSIIWQQGENKMWSAIGVLDYFSS